MEVSQTLDALERERELLREFHVLSSRQLALLDDENLGGVSKLLDARSDLMLELTAIETTLGTWITQLRNDSEITPEVLRELRSVNDEIVRLANEIVELDERIHWHLDLTKQEAAVSSYSMTVRIQPDFKLNG